MGAGDGAGDSGERTVAPIPVEEAVLQDGDAVALAAPLA